MRPHIVIRHVGLILILDSFFLFISFLIGFFNNDTSAIPLLYSALIALLLGLLPLVFVPTIEQISGHEGIMIVVASWLSTCLIGAVPFVLWGGEFTFTNAWFESVSGFTTTGSTILTNIEILPKGLLFWRSVTHFIGGIGVIMFALVMLPLANNNRLVIFNSEMSEVAKTNFRDSVKQVVRVLVYVYLGLTILETVTLWMFGMNLFDASTHAFATIATGGFSTKNLSVASFNSLPIEVTIMIFMVLSGIHFGLLYSTVLGKKTNVFKSEVVRYYIIAMVVGIAIISIVNYNKEYATWGNSIRYAAFQVISLGTTTGFATADTANWAPVTKLILIFFTIQCAGAGSTSGGIKVDRIVLFFKALKKQVKLIQHPRAVIEILINKRPIPSEVVYSALGFIILYLFIIFISSLLISAMGVDIMTSFSAAAATIGNVGPGFGGVSSMGNFAGLPSAAKWILSANMLFGRVEIYGFISLLMVRSWK